MFPLFVDTNSSLLVCFSRRRTPLWGVSLQVPQRWSQTPSTAGRHSHFVNPLLLHRCTLSLTFNPRCHTCVRPSPSSSACLLSRSSLPIDVGSYALSFSNPRYGQSPALLFTPRVVFGPVVSAVEVARVSKGCNINGFTSTLAHIHHRWVPLNKWGIAFKTRYPLHALTCMHSRCHW